MVPAAWDSRTSTDAVWRDIAQGIALDLIASGRLVQIETNLSHPDEANPNPYAPPPIERRHGRREPGQRVDHAAIGELVEDIARLAGTGKAGEARAARADAPTRHGHGEGHGGAHQGLGIEPAPRQFARQRLEVLAMIGEAGPVVVGDEIGGYGGHGVFPNRTGALRILAGERDYVAGVDVDDVAGRLRRRVGSEEVGRLGDILRKDRQLQQRALPIDLLQLVDRHLVRLGALVAPLALPDLRAAQHRVGIDAVDADAVRRPSSARQRARCNSSALAAQ